MATRRLRALLPFLKLDGPTRGRLVPRLRRVTRRLGAVSRYERLIILLTELERSGERRGRQALDRVRDDVARRAEDARAELFHRKVGDDVRRASEKLGALLPTHGQDSAVAANVADMRVAVGARVARRAGTLKAAIGAAGSVYLAGRLKTVRTDLTRLRFGADLAAEIGAGATAADVRTLVRVHAMLVALGDMQALIECARDVQGSLATPDLKAWRDLDAVIVALENRCRGLHARYVHERDALVRLCDRLAARASAAGATRKAS